MAARYRNGYAITSDLPPDVVDAKILHSRYKDLTLVEKAFRTCKTTHLEVRPIYVRKEASTRGHVVVVMLAYLIVRELRRAWADFDLTVEEGLEELNQLCAMEMSIQDGGSCLRIPDPSPRSEKLLEALDVKLPGVLPKSTVKVDTKRNLQERRKNV